MPKKVSLVRSEIPAKYETGASAAVSAEDRAVIDHALEILAGALRKPGDTLTSTRLTRDFCVLHLAGREREYFTVILLDSQNRVIGIEDLFAGSLSGSMVAPREVVKLALHHNAGAVIFAHNHPSGHPEPSQADITSTRRLVQALDLVEVRVLDHLVIGGTETVSLAERGLM